MLAASSSPIVVLSSLAFVTVIFQITLLVIAVRAFVQGREYVWECTWHWPVRVALAFQAICRWYRTGANLGVVPAMLARHPAWSDPAVRFVSSFLPRAAVNLSALSLPRTVVLPFGLPPTLVSVLGVRNSRRPVRAQHYLTVGERMRAARRSAA